RVKVEVKDIGDIVGQHAEGSLRLNENMILAGKDPAQMTEAMLHEFVHNQQGSLIVRKLTDDLEKAGAKQLSSQEIAELQQIAALKKEGKPLTPEQASKLEKFDKEVGDKLRKAYLDETKVLVGDERLLEILRARDGKPLDASQVERAEALMKAFRENKPVGIEFVKVNNELANLENPGAAKKLIERLSKDDGTLAKELFGSEKLPPDVQRSVDAF